MQARKLPAGYLPLAFGGAVATALTLAALRLAGLDHRSAAGLIGFSDPALFRLVIYSLWTAATAVTLARLLRKHGFGPDALGWEGKVRVSAGAGAMAALAALATVMVWLPIDSLRGALGIPLYWDPAQQGFIRPRTLAEFAVAGAVGLILVPLSEETIFRGYVLQVVVQRLGLWPGLLAHNALFALYHAGIGPGLPIYIFVWSFFPALLFLRYRSIYPPILMHALNNVWVDFLLPILF